MPKPSVGRQLLHHEPSDISACNLAAIDAGEVGDGPDAPTSGSLVSMAEQQRQEQPVEHEAAVAAAVPDPQGADADQTAHAVARHRRDEASCCDGRQADLAERAQAVPNELTTAAQPFKRNGPSL